MEGMIDQSVARIILSVESETRIHIRDAKLNLIPSMYNLTLKFLNLSCDLKNPHLKRGRIRTRTLDITNQTIVHRMDLKVVSWLGC